MKNIKIGDGDVVKSFEIGKSENLNDSKLTFILGPCAIESHAHSIEMVEKIGEIASKFDINWIFKSCYDKDCRSNADSFHGVGIDEGLSILKEIREKYKVAVTSDFSDPRWAQKTGEVVDLIQIPAYLCRQTSILREAAKTGKAVHLKKGQFMSPWNMKNSVKKLEAFGCEQMLLTDRGTFFGYNMLINDYRCLPIMAENGHPVCFDATHSIQMPTSMGNVSGGQREFIPHLVRAAVGCGVDALFIETHENPDKALSDPNTVLDLKYLEMVIDNAVTVHKSYLELIDKWGNEYIHR